MLEEALFPRTLSFQTGIFAQVLLNFSDIFLIFSAGLQLYGLSGGGVRRPRTYPPRTLPLPTTVVPPIP